MLFEIHTISFVKYANAKFVPKFQVLCGCELIRCSIYSGRKYHKTFSLNRFITFMVQTNKQTNFRKFIFIIHFIFFFLSIYVATLPFNSERRFSFHFQFDVAGVVCVSDTMYALMLHVFSSSYLRFSYNVQYLALKFNFHSS